MFENKKIIVSMTSWKKRIDDVPKIIYMMERQTVIPDEIVLNLSSDEFPNLEKDLPANLILFANVLDNFKICWVKENTRAFKKVIPTIAKHYDEDCLILSIDDDYLYYTDYVEFVVKTALMYDNNYITVGTEGNFVHGWCSVYRPVWFKDEKLDKLTVAEMNSIVSSDLWITVNLENNKIKPVKIPEIAEHYTKLESKFPLWKLYNKIPLTKRKIACFAAARRIGRRATLCGSLNQLMV